MMPDAHSQHERELEYENMRLEAEHLRRGIADRDEFLEIIHQTRMFEIWREQKNRTCVMCGGSGFVGTGGRGYGDVCPECGGQQQ